MTDYNAILEMIQPRKPSDYEAMARIMSEGPVNSVLKHLTPENIGNRP